jgi:DNA-binding winged helix-turn-helix (wHTH) protein/TolB-like protein/Tfp pilus assembly protein PilF
MKSDGPQYRFGPFLLLPSEHLLSRDGRPVHLPRKTFDLLVALVEQAGHLVSKEHLQDRLWRDAIVEEGNLNKHVSMLRKALGERDGVEKFIETVSRVGFRFVASVELIKAPSDRIVAGPRVPAAWIAALLLLAALGTTLALRGRNAVSPERSRWNAVAVLPFTTFGAVDHEWLGLGLADGVITRLSGQRLLAVRPTSAVRPFAGAGRVDLAAVSRLLNVDVVLEGHLQGDGKVVRVTVQLIDVKSAAPVWGDSFDQPTASVLDLEAAIAERVATALRLQLAAAEQPRVRRRYTDNLEAYRAYTAGRGELARYTREGTEHAIAFFEQALAIDPAYALARSGLALASADMHLRFAQGADAERWGARAASEARRALDIDQDLAEAHLARAAVLRKREFEWDQTIETSRRALTLNPSLDQAHFFTAAAFYHLGLMDQALGALERGRDVGGADLVEPARIEGLIALFTGDFRTARRRLEDVSLNSSRQIGDTYLALAYFYLGDLARARGMLERLSSEAAPSTAARSRATLAAIAAATGDASTARGLLASVLAGQYQDHHVAYAVGATLAQLGDPTLAVTWLRRAADTGFPCAIWYERDPLLGLIRRHPDFLALSAELAARRDAARARHSS